MALPNFLIIGVGKSGTTSLYHYLGQHPEIGMSRLKEPKFLLYEGHRRSPIPGKNPRFQVTTVEAYAALFSDCEDRPARGDVTPTYIVYPEQTIYGIRKYVPDARMIAVFRQPVDRAYSNYLMHVRNGNEPLASFPEALRAEAAGRARTDGRPRSYLGRGFYWERTKKFLQAFPRDRFLFLLYDDLVKDPALFLQSIFRFLGVRDSFDPDLQKRHNVGAWPRSRLANRFLKTSNLGKKILARVIPDSVRKGLAARFHAVNLRTPPPLDPALRRELTLQYREDILGLQELIGRDLAHWL
jgi:hypothetical protein